MNATHNCIRYQWSSLINNSGLDLSSVAAAPSCGDGSVFQRGFDRYRRCWQPSTDIRHDFGKDNNAKTHIRKERTWGINFGLWLHGVELRAWSSDGERRSYQGDSRCG